MMIFTGMDNSGKTTIVQKTAKKLGLPVVKSLGPDHPVDEKHIWLLDQMTREKAFPGSVIFDRFLPFEEMVYEVPQGLEPHHRLHPSSLLYHLQLGWPGADGRSD